MNYNLDLYLTAQISKYFVIYVTVKVAYMKILHAISGQAFGEAERAFEYTVTSLVDFDVEQFVIGLVNDLILITSVEAVTAAIHMKSIDTAK